MDLYLLIILPMVGLLSGSFLNLLPEILTRFIVSRIIIRNEGLVNELDERVMKSKPKSRTITVTGKQVPSNTWYWMYPMLLIRSMDATEEYPYYEAFGLESHINSLLDNMQQDDIDDIDDSEQFSGNLKSEKRRIIVYYRERIHINRFIQTLPQLPFSGQRKLLDLIVPKYRDLFKETDPNPKLSLSILIFGEPGAGKSCFSRLLTYALGKKTKLVLGCDMTDPLFMFREIYRILNKDDDIGNTIIVFDEIDRTFEHAESGIEKGKDRSLARNKQSLVGV